MSGTPRTIRPGYPPLKWSDMEEAFRDINQNFNDIYATIMSDGSTQVVNFSALYDDVSPAVASTYALGSETRPWKKLYVAEFIDGLGTEDNGLWLGTAQIRGSNGIIDLPANSTIGGEIVFNPDRTFWSEIQVDDNLNLVPTSIGATLDLNSGTGMQLVVDSAGGSITFNNDGVTELTASTGISLSDTTGDIVITNTGVTSITNTTSLPSGRSTGAGIHVDSSSGAVRITNTGIISLTTTYGIILSTNAATGEAEINWDPSVGITSAFNRIHIEGESVATDIQAGPAASALTLVEGNGISFATDPVTDRLTISISRGDLVGSIFGDDSSLLVDAVESKVYAPNGFFGDVNGTLLGNVNISTGQSNFNDIVIQGNLIVQGATTSVETTNTQVTDNIIVLNNGEPGAGVTSGASGIEIDRGSETNRTLIWDETIDKWTVGLETFVAGAFEATNFTGDVIGNVTGDVTGNVTGTIFGELIGTAIADVKGSIFGEDSTMLVDATNSRIVGIVDTVSLFAQNISTTDSSAINVNTSVNFSTNINVGGDIIPTTSFGGELGSEDLVWSKLYLGNSVVIKGSSLSVRDGSILTLNGVAIGGLGAITWDDILLKPTFSTVAETGSYNDLLDKPTSFSNLTGLAFTTGTSVNEFSTDGTLAGDSDDAVPTEQAVKTYVDNRFGNWVFTNNSVNSTDSTALTFSTAAQFNASINVDEDITVNGNLISPRITSTEMIQDLTLTQTYDKITLLLGSTGDVTHNCSLGSIFYHQTPAANFTPDLTNLLTTDNRVLSVVIIVEQGATPYLPTALKISGSSQTIQWVNAAGTPSGNANQTDVVSFNLIRVGAAWKVLGSLSTFG